MSSMTGSWPHGLRSQTLGCAAGHRSSYLQAIRPRYAKPHGPIASLPGDSDPTSVFFEIQHHGAHMKPNLMTIKGLTSRALAEKSRALKPRSTYPVLSILPTHRGPLHRL